ncbi:hypothetical protein A1QK_00495 [Vibrio genomosp. F10 str. 9ZD137]|nr:hypothetical protein A1QK_00495 [Vibrio genomosp. F10 str. 9ZD137]
MRFLVDTEYLPWNGRHKKTADKLSAVLGFQRYSSIELFSYLSQSYNFIAWYISSLCDTQYRDELSIFGYV